MASRAAFMTLPDWLDDLTVRFLLNLPPAEMSSMPRLCFQVEEAQWFYEDFVRPANPQLPSLNLRQFCLTLFRHTPLLSGFSEAQHAAAYEEFLAYKVRVPVRGAILMDESMEKVLLVRGWKKGASWSFPRGKINRDEKDLDCAIREVYEETGYDLRAAGLVTYNAQDGDVKSIDITMREQHMRLFVFRGVPLDTHFEPRTRREIGGIEWYNVKDLPGFKRNKGQPGHGMNDAMSTKFYMVAPFLGHLKKWIGQQLKRGVNPATARHGHNLSISDYDINVPATEDETDAGTMPGASFLNHDPAAITPHFTTSHNQTSSHTGNDLLAMLNGTRLATIGNPTWPQPIPGPAEQYAHYGPGSGQIFEADSAQLPYNPLREPVGQQYVQRGPTQSYDQQAVPQHSSYNPSIAPGHIASQQQMFDRPNLYSRDGQLQPVLSQQTALPSHIQSDQWNQGHVSTLPSNSQLHQNARSQIAPVHGKNVEALPMQQNIPLSQLFGQGQSQSSTLLGLLKQPKASQSMSHNGTNPLFDATNPDTRSLDHNGGRSASHPLLRHPSPGHVTISVGQSHPFQRANNPNLPQMPHTQGEVGPFSVGPPIPEASDLPTKTLNMHAAKLLDAFKIANANKAEGDGRLAGSFTAPDLSAQKPNNQHQSALLGLLHKASVPDPVASSSAPSAAIQQQERAASPALTDKTETSVTKKIRDGKATSQQPPKAAHSPAKPVAETKATPVAQQPHVAATPRNNARKEQSKRTAPPTANRPAASKVVELSTSAERPKSRGQLFDPSKPSKSTSAVTPPVKSEVAHSVATGDARTSSKGTPRSSAHPSRQRPPPNAQPTPHFSILQRPGSAAGKTSVPPSPLRNESSKTGTFQPQLLKRSVGEVEWTPEVQGKTPEVQLQTSTDKRDNLLALFSKTTASPAIQATKISCPPPQPAAAQEPGPTVNQKDKLLNLFSAKSPNPSVNSIAPPPSSTKTLSPSVAPQLHPEIRSSSRQSQQTNSSTSQQLLLNLFNNNSNNNNAPQPVMSPGTPISPFALGTPVMTRALPTIGGQPPLKLQQQHHQPPHMSLSDLIAPPVAKSRVGSLQPSSASLSGSLASGQQTPTSATPTEAKNFLLDYLNGVVQKESGGKANTNARGR
jgi:mRNA-decapping enzyme subunit 2